MSTDRLNLYTYALKGQPSQRIEISVSYQLGGWNYFTGNLEKRGYYIDVQPVERADGWTRFTAFTGVKGFFQEAKRFSAPTLKKLHQDILANVDGKYGDYVQQLFEYVLTKNSLDVANYDLLKGE